MKRFTVLGMETSCDETSVALLDCDFSTKLPKVRILKHVVSSQMDIHAKYGGVVPEVAARSHVPEIVSLLTGALNRRDPLSSFDAIAVTKGPGLASALRVGVQAAQTLAWTSGKPAIGVNHLEGHLASAWLVPANRKNWAFPALALLVSGGHTELVFMKDFCSYRVLGSTRDDAAGEAFDKSAKLLGLGYPGGPAISKHAINGNDEAYDFPRPMINDSSLDMSFSGLKTAIRIAVERAAVGARRAVPLRGKRLHDICASIEKAIVDVLVAKTIRATKKHPVKAVLLVGGVSANRRLRSDLAAAVRKELPGVRMMKSPIGLATDNAAMIAAAGAWHLARGESHDWKKMDAEPELGL